MFYATYVPSLGGGGGGGGGPPTVPGGADTDIQFNNNGAFGGNSALTYNKLGTAPTIQLGDSATFGNTPAMFWADCGAGQQFVMQQGNPAVGGGAFVVLGRTYAYWGTSGAGWLADANSGTVSILASSCMIAQDGGTNDIGATPSGSLGRFRDLILTGAWASGYSLDTTAITGSTVTIPNHTSSYILAPTAPVATMSLILPAAPKDGLEISLGCTVNGATTLTLLGNSGQTLTGAVTSLLPGEFARYKWLSGIATWARVG